MQYKVWYRKTVFVLKSLNLRKPGFDLAYAGTDTDMQKFGLLLLPEH